MSGIGGRQLRSGTRQLEPQLGELDEPGENSPLPPLEENELEISLENAPEPPDDPAGDPEAYERFKARFAQWKLLRRAFEAGQRAQARDQPALSPSPAASHLGSTKEPKIKEPDTFSGTNPAALKSFLLQCRLMFELNSSRYSSEDTKVLAMVAYLRGPALACVQPLLSQEPRVAELLSVGAFTAYLRASFGDPDERGTAKRQLRELRQDKDAASYFARIRELATIAGYTDQVAIVDIAVAGLRANLKDELAKRGDFDTLAELVGFVVPLDNRLRRRSEERKKEETHSPPSQTYAGTPAKSRLDGRLDPRQPEPRPSLLPPRQQPAFAAARQDLRRDSPRPAELSPQEGRRPYGPLSEAEKDRRRRAGTCIICDKPGHFASDCPSRSNKPREPVIAKPEAPKA